jgi:hypothetical protein
MAVSESQEAIGYPLLAIRYPLSAFLPRLLLSIGAHRVEMIQ